MSSADSSRPARERVPSTAAGANRAGLILEVAAFVILLAICALRPIIPERYESARGPLSEGIQEIADPSPVTTLVLDWFLFIAAMLWSLSRVLLKKVYQRSGLEAGLVLLAIASAISCIAAGQKRLAINASMDWIATLLSAIMLVQLLGSAWRRRLLLAVTVATAAVQAEYCIEQSYITFSETWEHYQEHKKEIWERQGVSLDSNQVELFERRMLAREATGFMPHSNVTGAYLATCALLAAGAALTFWKQLLAQGRSALLTLTATLVVLALLFATYLTTSKGAMVALAAAAALWMGVRMLQPWIQTHRGLALQLGWLGFALAGCATVGYGVLNDSLPGESLTFRWHYWRNSAALIRDHWQTGVGRENFGRHYPKYKAIDSAEEVSNPHNLFVHAAAELGGLGLAGMIALLVGGSAAIVRSLSDPDRKTAADAHEAKAHQKSENRLLFLGGGAAFAAVALLRGAFLGSSNPHFLFYVLTVGAMVWTPVFFVFVNAPWTRGISASAAYALFAFVLQDMISFATFVPGAFTTACSVFALAVAKDAPSAQARHRRVAWLQAGLSAGIVVIVAAVALRQYRAYQLLSAGRKLVELPLAARVDRDYFARAAAWDPLDPSPWIESAQWLHVALREASTTAFEPLDCFALEQAIRRDPHNHSLRKMLARMWQNATTATGKPEYWEKAVAAGANAVALYPLDPVGLVFFGELQLAAYEATGNSQALREGIAALERALQLESIRPHWAVFQGLNLRERTRVEQLIHEARQKLK